MKPIDSTDPRRGPEPREAGRPVIPPELQAAMELLGVTGRPVGPPPEIPATIRIGDRMVRLDGWERMVLRAHGLGSDAHGRPWPTLVASSIALRLRVAGRAREDREHDSPDVRAGRVEHNRIDSGLAGGLLRQLEWTQRRLTQDGEARLATRLTEVIDDVDRIAAGTRVFLGDAAGGSPAAADSSFSDDAYRQKWPAVMPVDREEPPPVFERTPKSDAAPHFRLRLRFGKGSILLIGLALIVVTTAVLLIPVGTRRPQVTAAGLGPLFQLPGVVDASAMSGTVTVTIDAKVWAGLSEARRAEERARIFETTREAGYLRVDLRTGDGGTLASD